MRTRITPSQITPLDPLPPATSQIHRSGLESVTYHIPTSRSNLKTTIQLPRTSQWTSGLHFHTTHTEYLHLLRGCITVQLGTERKTFSASAGGEVDSRGKLITPGLVITVPKYVRHNWGRASHMLRRYQIGGKREVPEDWSDDVVVEEWTDPSDLSKPLFFWNLNGVITAPADRPMPISHQVAKWMMGGWWIPFQLFTIFWELDNWPVFLSLENLGLGMWLEQNVEFAMTFFVLYLVSLVARVLGVKAIDEERTPKELWAAWQEEKSGGKRA
jgi:hypothetical protein